MIRRIMTITLDGDNAQEYEAIKARLAAEGMAEQGWQIDHDPLLNRVTATKREQVPDL